MKKSKRMSPEEILSYVTFRQTLKIKEAISEAAGLGAKMALELERDLEDNKGELVKLSDSMGKLGNGTISIVEANAISREARRKLSALNSKLRLANTNIKVSKTFKIIKSC